jgi:hypothetical protein
MEAEQVKQAVVARTASVPARMVTVGTDCRAPAASSWGIAGYQRTVQSSKELSALARAKVFRAERNKVPVGPLEFSRDRIVEPPVSVVMSADCFAVSPMYAGTTGEPPFPSRRGHVNEGDYVEITARSADAKKEIAAFGKVVGRRGIARKVPDWGKWRVIGPCGMRHEGNVLCLFVLNWYTLRSFLHRSSKVGSLANF